MSGGEAKKRWVCVWNVKGGGSERVSENGFSGRVGVVEREGEAEEREGCHFRKKSV